MRSTSGRSTCGDRSTTASHGRKISPDLTRAEPETLDDSGGPIVKDQDGPEIYGTLYAITPSPHEAGTIWTGSDDGLVHVSRDDGGTWRDVTPPDMPAHTRVMTGGGVPARASERDGGRDPVRDGRSIAVRVEAPTTTARPGLASAMAFPMAPSCAWCGRIRSARDSSTRAPSTACSCPSMAARAGATCRSSCRTRRSRGFRSRSAIW